MCVLVEAFFRCAVLFWYFVIIDNLLGRPYNLRMFVYAILYIRIIFRLKRSAFTIRERTSIKMRVIHIGLFKRPICSPCSKNPIHNVIDYTLGICLARLCAPVVARLLLYILLFVRRILCVVLLNFFSFIFFMVFMLCVFCARMGNLISIHVYRYIYIYGEQQSERH